MANILCKLLLLFFVTCQISYTVATIPIIEEYEEEFKHLDSGSDHAIKESERKCENLVDYITSIVNEGQKSVDHQISNLNAAISQIEAENKQGKKGVRACIKEAREAARDLKDILNECHQCKCPNNIQKSVEGLKHLRNQVGSNRRRCIVTHPLNRSILRKCFDSVISEAMQSIGGLVQIINQNIHDASEEGVKHVSRNLARLPQETTMVLNNIRKCIKDC